METRRRVAILTVVGVFALALAPAAFAQSTGTGYSGVSGVAGQTTQGNNGGGNNGVAGATKTGTGSAASQASGNGNGVLAFTGLDLALLAGGGLVLLASGVALSRLVGRRSSA